MYTWSAFSEVGGAHCLPLPSNRNILSAAKNHVLHPPNYEVSLLAIRWAPAPHHVTPEKENTGVVGVGAF